jgi:hypothetical protein
MLTTVEGIYRGGKIELAEQPSAAEGAKVLVTFLPARKGRRKPGLRG